MKNLNIENRTIFYRDNIDVLQGINTKTIDLIYLDPPFSKNDTFVNKNNKNIEHIKEFFIHRTKQRELQFQDINFEEVFKNNSAAFDDIWQESDINEKWYTQLDNYNKELVNYLKSIQKSTMRGTFYYLIYMAIRLIEMHRVLKDTGSLYLHCDPTMSHYLKVILDKIFGHQNFRNEIVWCYKGGFSNAKKFMNKTDLILFYTKTNNYVFFNQYTELDKEYIEQAYKYKDEHGRKYKKSTQGGKPYNVYLDTRKGNPVLNWWSDIKSFGIATNSKERTGYPTQKPLALLERIIKASSKPGDTVLDPFCGCATTCLAAEHLQRKWIGIDINEPAYYMIYYRIYQETNVKSKPTDVSTEYNKMLFGDELKQSIEAPLRTDISKEEREQLEREAKEREKFSQQKKIQQKKTLSTQERKIAKGLLYEEQKGMCNGCDIFMRSADLTLDHITPQAAKEFYEKDIHDLENLQLLCYRCNNWKRINDMVWLIEKLKDEDIITEGTYEKQIERWRGQ